MADTSKELRQVLKQRQDSVTDCTKVAKDLNPNIKNALNAREATVSNEFSLNFTKVQYEGAKQVIIASTKAMMSCGELSFLIQPAMKSRGT